MTDYSGHLRWLNKNKDDIATIDGRKIAVFEFNYQNNEQILSEWAKHIRNHYCLDSEIDALRKGTSFSRSEYLRQIKFPDKIIPPGPSTRAGDFGEILVSDYLQFILGYWVPRSKYARKINRNESVKGSDVIGIKYFSEEKNSRKDTMVIFEIKTQFSSKLKISRLQDAIDDSAKDQLRIAETLNSIKQHFQDVNNVTDSLKIERFQNIEDNPFTEVFGAAAVISTHLFDENLISTTTTQFHPHSEDICLIIIRGQSLMELTNELFRRAADEA